MSYKHDYAEEVYAKVWDSKDTAKVPWPFKHVPDMGDTVRVRGVFYRVKFREFIFPANQDDPHRVVIWLEDRG